MFQRHVIGSILRVAVLMVGLGVFGVETILAVPTKGNSENGKKLYGELVMEVWIDRKGEVIEAIVTHSSGNKQLDKRAQSIVKKAGPFGAVPLEVSQGRDLLLISSRFRFTRDAALEASTTQALPNGGAP